MLVGVNLLWLVPGVVGGSEEYAVRLLRAFRRLGSEGHTEFVLYTNRRFSRAHRDLSEGFLLYTGPLDGTWRSWRVAVENTWLAVRSRRPEAADLVHHLGGTVPFWRGAPAVVTIHDLQPLVYPSRFGLAKRTWLRVAIPQSARAACRIVVLSEYTRRDLVERVGISTAKVEVIYPGVDPPDPAEANPERVARVRRIYELDGRAVFLYPAITYGHKNHRVLVRALARLAPRQRPVLVLTGGEAEAEEELAELVRSESLEGWVRRTGRIPRDDLDTLYHLATALVFPSRFEGFGLPVVEAMVRGCPVVASKATALPEVVGEAGMLVHPDDVDGWANAMRRMMEDEDFARRLSQAALERVRRYSWEKAARAHLELYRQVSASADDASGELSP